MSSDDDKQPGPLTVSGVLARRNMTSKINDDTWRPNSVKEALAELGRSDDGFVLFVTHLTHLPLIIQVEGKISEWMCKNPPGQRPETVDIRDVQTFIRQELYTQLFVRAGMDAKAVTIQAVYPEVERRQIREWFMCLWCYVVSQDLVEHFEVCVVDEQEENSQRVVEEMIRMEELPLPLLVIPEDAKQTAESPSLSSPHEPNRATPLLHFYRTMNPVIENTLNFWVSERMVAIAELEEWIWQAKGGSQTAQS
jgi:hypothetical protein